MHDVEYSNRNEKSTFIATPKKPGAAEPEVSYGTISLMRQITKNLLRIQ